MSYRPKYVTKKKRETAARKRVAERPQPAKPDWETLRPLIHAKMLGCCYLCGEPLPLLEMTTDHAVIQKMGQRKNDSLENLMPCCGRCNTLKGSRRLIPGEECDCGQMYIVRGLGCLRCAREDRNSAGVRTERTGRFTI